MRGQDPVGRLMDAYGKAPLLTQRAVIELFKQYRAGLSDDATTKQQRLSARAKQRILTCNLRLVVAIAMKKRTKAERVGIPLEDLIQEGTIGLNRAVELFEYAKGYQFSTYAYWWILQSIGRAMEIYGLIRIPNGPSLLINKLRFAPPELVATREKVMEFLDINERQLRNLEMAMAAQQMRSLDAPTRNEDSETSALGDLLADPNTEPDLDAMDHQLALEQLEAALPEDLQLVQQSLACSVSEMAAQQGITRNAAQKQIQSSKSRLRAVGGSLARVVAA